MLEDLKNRFDFFVRNKTRFSRKNFVEKNRELVERNMLENEYTKDILSKAFTKRELREAKILDIGCKNWFYAKGEYDFFKSFCKKISLDGVEIDAFRLYSNFYSRYEVAKYYTKELVGTNYICDNLLNIKDRYDYIVWFLPFVLIEPHLCWGLPKKCFYPKKLLEHAYSLLNNDAEMLIVNQGEAEADTQKALLDELNIPYKFLGELKSEKFEYKNKRFGFLVTKVCNQNS